MKKTTIAPHIYHVRFPTVRELASTFLRFQEHYESPEFGGQVFTLKAYRDWYRKKYGSFTYLTDWNGFNIPSWVLFSFYLGRFKRVTKQEKALLELFRKHWESGERFYIIGTADNSKEQTLDHEIAHGLYATNPRYKKAVDKILGHNKFKDIRKLLKVEEGYAESVIPDEIHAYLGHSLNYLVEKEINIKRYAEITKRLQRLFRKYYHVRGPNEMSTGKICEGCGVKFTRAHGRSVMCRTCWKKLGIASHPGLRALYRKSKHPLAAK